MTCFLALGSFRHNTMSYKLDAMFDRSRVSGWKSETFANVTIRTHPEMFFPQGKFAGEIGDAVDLTT